MKEPKCFQTIENPTLIDLMLANSRSSFQDSFAIGSDVSDFYKTIVIESRQHFKILVSKLTYHKIKKALAIMNSGKI